MYIEYVASSYLDRTFLALRHLLVKSGCLSEAREINNFFIIPPDCRSTALPEKQPVVAMAYGNGFLSDRLVVSDS
jgi:hypothetical protein